MTRRTIQIYGGPHDGQTFDVEPLDPGLPGMNIDLRVFGLDLRREGDVWVLDWKALLDHAVNAAEAEARAEYVHHKLAALLPDVT